MNENSEGWKNGLSTSEAESRLKEYGYNDIARKKRFVALKILLSQFKSPLVYVLLIAAVITVGLQDYVDAVVIMAAVVVNTVLGFFQEYRAEKSLEALKKVLDPKAKVRRNGKWVIIPAVEIVPGDLVFLSDEHKVPADGVLFDEDGLHTNEAILTGESRPVEKFNYGGESSDFESLVRGYDKIENKYKAFMGTEVKSGVGKLLVLMTGHKTEMGRIAGLLKASPETETPLQIKVRKLSLQLAGLVAVVSILILVSGVMTGKDFTEIFLTAVALAVSAIPEGLAVSLTVVLAIGVQRILRKKAVMRRLSAAETLGSVDVICADKTGTLTTGVMKVTESVVSNKSSGLRNKNSKSIEDVLVKAAVLCNDMRDPLEIGMNDWAVEKLGSEQKRDSLRKEFDRLDSMPFNSMTKFVATLHKKVKGEQLLFVSGAPEVILDKTMIKGSEKTAWGKQFTQKGREGFRLVGFSYKVLKGTERKKISKEDLKGLTWLGILLYEDPIREGVKMVLPQVAKAGIAVKVITGDHKETAMAVMRQLGLVNDGNDELVLEGKDIQGMGVDELYKKIEKVILFARTNPEQKLMIVEALKKHGHVVAMTGDGVNDAPALKLADIGIVVNEASEVSKETADMVLLDNNFETIVHAIEEGRGIYENFRKIIVYLLADAFAEILVVVVSIILGWPLPIIAVQILWINLISDGLPNLALTIEPKEEGLLNRPPRPRKVQLIDNEILLLILLISGTAAVTTLFAFRYYWNGTEYSLDLARTVAFAMLGVNSLFYVFSSRSLSTPIWRVNFFRNPWLIAAVLVGMVLQVAVTYLPDLQKIFRTVAIGFEEWAIIVIASLILVMIVEGVKFVYTRRS